MLHRLRQSRTLHTLTAGPKFGVHFSVGVIVTCVISVLVKEYSLRRFDVLNFVNCLSLVCRELSPRLLWVTDSTARVFFYLSFPVWQTFAVVFIIDIDTPSGGQRNDGDFRIGMQAG
jgi:hypothetical protein